MNTFLNSGISTVLSPWRLAATAVQLQFGLRQLGRAMANDSTKQAASASLDKMTSVLFHHSIASEEACFIAEMVKEIDSAVAEKVSLFTTLDESLVYRSSLQFVNNGMESLVEILARPSTLLSLENLTERIDRAGEILRLLSHVMEPFRTKGTVFQLDANCQERLGKGICETLSCIESMFTAAGAEASKPLTQSVLFLARLLQFKLGFGGMWTHTAREQYGMLSSALLRLALVCVCHGES